MQQRIFNFSPGPAILPEPVLEQAREDLWSIDDSGIGILEQSHRGATFERVIEEAEKDCQKLAGISDDYAVLFLQGGASTQFYMLPANFLPSDGTADYLVTGSWSKKAVKEAEYYGGVHVACTSKDANFSYIPAESETRYSEAPAYVHFTSNNTIFGTEFRTEPTPPGLRVTPGSPATPPATSSRGPSKWSATASSTPAPRRTSGPLGSRW
jgi:phosphoserine aminotransferase